MQGNKMKWWMDVWGKGGMANGQNLILSKQEDKENKWKVDEKKKQQVSNPSSALDEREMAASVMCMINNP